MDGDSTGLRQGPNFDDLLINHFVLLGGDEKSGK